MTALRISSHLDDRRLFLSTLLDALRSGVQGTLAASLLGHIVTGLLLCATSNVSGVECGMAAGQEQGRTKCELGLVGLVVFVFLDNLLLGLLVVKRVGSSWR